MTIDPAHAVKLTKKWLDRLGLGHWKFEVVVANTPDECDQNEDCEAYVWDKAPYEWARFHYHGHNLEDDHELNIAVAHECLHLLFAEERIAMRKVMPHKMADIPHERHINRVAEALVRLESNLE